MGGHLVAGGVTTSRRHNSLETKAQSLQKSIIAGFAVWEVAVKGTGIGRAVVSKAVMAKANNHKSGLECTEYCF